MSTRRITRVFHNDVLTLLAVVSVDSSHSRTATACQLTGKLHPVALVVCGPVGAYALDMEGRPLDLERLIRDVPELDTRVTHSMKARGRAGNRGGTG